MKNEYNFVYAHIYVQCTYVIILINDSYVSGYIMVFQKVIHIFQNPDHNATLYGSPKVNYKIKHKGPVSHFVRSHLKRRSSNSYFFSSKVP